MGMFSIPPQRMGQLAQAGFELAGPFYPGELVPDRLQAARDAGLGIVHSVGYPPKRYVQQRRIDWTLTQIQQQLREQVHALASDPTIVAWYLWPEELRFNRGDDLDYLRAATYAIRAADDLRRPILHYQPNGRSREQLLPIVEHLDWAAVGMYTNYGGHREHRGFVRWATEQLVAAATDAGPRVVPFAVLEMFQDPPAADSAPVEGWVRHDTFAALLCGARGLLVFSGWARPRFDTYGRYFDAYVAVADELNGKPGLADPILAGTPVSVASRIVLGPARTSFTTRGARTVLPSALVRSFERDGQRWTYVVNSASSRVVLELDTSRQMKELGGSGGWDPNRRWMTLPAFAVGVLHD